MARSPIRIVHLITGLSVGGAENMLFKLLRRMNKKVFNNSVLSLTNIGEIGQRIADLGIAVEALGMRRDGPNILKLWKLSSRIREMKPHILQTWLYHADLLGLITAQISGRPPVIWNLRCSYMGDGYYSGGSGMLLRILSRLSGLPDAVIHNSQAGRKFHTNLGYRPKRWLLVPNGFDTDELKPDIEARRRIRSEIGIPESSPLIGMVGRFDPVKGHNTFFSAAQILRQELPDVRFLLVGPGCTESNSKIQKLVPPGMENVVVMLGERSDIPALNAALDVATCASVGEGFPNVVGEAMACGVPCVVTDSGDCAQIIGESGRLVPANSAILMANAWGEILNSGPKVRSGLSLSARARIERKFSINKVVGEYEKLYREIAHKGCS